MITLKEISQDGTSREITFSDKTEACKTLSLMFGAEMPESVRRQEERDSINAELRRQFQRGRSTNDPHELIERARRGL